VNRITYSTFMYIYDWKKIGEDAFLEILREAREVFESTVEYELDDGFWSKDRDDYQKFEDFMFDGIKEAMRDYPDESIFIFCNHDGITDEEVFRLFIIVGKIIASLHNALQIRINSHVHLYKVYFINRETGFHEVEISSDALDEIWEYLFSKHKLKKAEQDLKEAKEKISKYEKELAEKGAEVMVDGRFATENGRNKEDLV